MEEPSLFKSLLKSFFKSSDEEEKLEPLACQRCNTEVVEMREKNQLDLETSGVNTGSHFVAVDEVPTHRTDLPTLAFNKCESMEYSCNGSKIITSHNNGVVNIWNSQDMSLCDSFPTYKTIT